MAKKRLALFLDGTWKTAEDRGRSSNVVKMMRAVDDHDGDIEQIVHYDKGVGTGGGWDRLRGGAFGKGLDANVKEAYTFLGNNYQDGDEIYLFGFSRGAYTARAVAGMIEVCGLLDRASLDHLSDAWDMYRTPPERRDSNRIKGWKGRDVPIACVGVWDTVGSLGIPLRWFRFNMRRKYAFYKTQLGPHVGVGLHAIASDEKRGQFPPTLWEAPEGKPPPGQVVEQVWFAGTHSDVGGGTGDAGLSDIALEWMVERVDHLTDLRFRANWRRYANGTGPPVAGNARGVLHESRSIGYAVSRVLPYQRVVAGHDGWTRRILKSRNRPTEGHAFVNECIHHSVLERMTAGAVPVRDGGRQRTRRYAPRNVIAARDAGACVTASVTLRQKADAGNRKAEATAARARRP